MSNTEAASEPHERWIEGLDKGYHELASQYKQQQTKLDDLEARSRRQNIHIVRIQEKTENVWRKMDSYATSLDRQQVPKSSFNFKLGIWKYYSSVHREKFCVCYEVFGVL